MGKKWLFPRKGPKDPPVTRVSWHDCQSFIDKLNNQTKGTYRLPWEAEWEYACRAGTGTVYSFGDEIDCSRAMVRPFLRGTVVRVGLFLGSGIILMSSNYFHPRYLSLVALPFVLAWVTAPFILKKR